MGLKIDTNVSALNAAQSVNKSTKTLGDALKQLASGLRINKSKDDASGLAIADNFQTQVRQSQTEMNNLQTGVNYAQTADAGLQSQSDAIQRVRDLAVQASNGTLSSDQRGALQAEAQQLTQQVNDVAKNTQFNGQNILNQNLTVALGTQDNMQVSVTQSNTASLGIGGVDLTTQAGAQAAIGQLDTAAANIGANRSNLGAQMNTFTTAINERDTRAQTATAAESSIRDVDVASSVMKRVRGQVLQQTGLAAMMQGNVSQQQALSLLRS